MNWLAVKRRKSGIGAARQAPGARVSRDRWRGRRFLVRQADADGEAELTSPPMAEIRKMIW
ncbi:hypothetical protein [Candidatus Amarolinea dominans]|uniref:hypothetical protein n=1 Tax=Candidatus Amarolinea dominans TaxID=3140696 RepID=UPI0031CC3DF8